MGPPILPSSVPNDTSMSKHWLEKPAEMTYEIQQVAQNSKPSSLLSKIWEKIKQNWKKQNGSLLVLFSGCWFF